MSPGKPDHTRAVQDTPPAVAASILADDDATDETTVLYTVTSGKTLSLTSCYLWATNEADTAQNAYIALRDDEDTEQIRWAMKLLADSLAAIGISFPTPVPLSEGWDVVIYSSDADLTAHGSITGYEV